MVLAHVAVSSFYAQPWKWPYRANMNRLQLFALQMLNYTSLCASSSGTRIYFALTLLPWHHLRMVSMARKRVNPRQCQQCQGKVSEQRHAFSGKVYKRS